MVRNPFSKRPLVPIIRLEGIIGATARLGGSAINDSLLAQPIERAFKGKPAAVALQINSPGGSPVQSALIAARIRRLADRHGREPRNGPIVKVPKSRLNSSYRLIAIIGIDSALGPLRTSLVLDLPLKRIMDTCRPSMAMPCNRCEFKPGV